MASHTDKNGTDVSDLRHKQVFTTGEVAHVCKISQQTVIRCFDSGKLNGFRVPGSRFRRIPREELLRFMRENDIPTSPIMDARRRVLVVDDDPEIVAMLVELLGSNGTYEVRTAGTGYEAGVTTEQFRPELLILDYMLPDVNGNIVCQTIRSNPKLADTRILIVSGVVNRDEIQGLLNAGADAFLKKPFDIQQLLDHVESLLEV